MAQVSMILRGLALGIGAAAPLGPVNVEIARRTLRHGFSAGLALGLGAVTVDVAYAILVNLSFRPAQIPSALMLTLGILGTLLLIYLGVASLRSAVNIDLTGTGPAAHSARHYGTGLLMTSLNPMTLAFWFIAVPSTVWKIGSGAQGGLPWMCAGVFIAAVSWVCAFAGLLSIAKGKLREQWLRAANLVGGLCLLGFAGMTIWRMARLHLS